MDRLEELLQFLKKFNGDRDWRQFHSENNLAKSIVLEANELLTEFQFDSNNYNKKAVEEELADVMAYCFDMCLTMGLDPIEIIYQKYQKNALKYPVEKAKGSCKKYNQF
ncbi:MAG: MazG-like family protein [Erysipelotrichaceae bacterium]|nr:MazG-like family protein [Erysipelotrichaceae bacterium]